MDTPRYEIFEEENGRWYWELKAAEGAAGGPRGTGATYSPVGFPTREEAELNLHLFDTSPSDRHGRKVLPKATLDDLIRLAADGCPDCVGVEIAPVRPQAPDHDGCNWTWRAASDAAAGCVDCVREAVEALRAICNLPDRA
ncbi:hypothetical protein [Burkholderia plantarii]|uniref:hypothetical protein n=1 Tax=Burkholderia plantarii TaxID=41899 RepID=UPI0018DC8E5C|nr:hypothetical protein [Burkholderia plantarii]MBI0328294.1 hypothetical protein [Burkholderia plantarii]